MKILIIVAALLAILTLSNAIYHAPSIRKAQNEREKQYNVAVFCANIVIAVICMFAIFIAIPV